MQMPAGERERWTAETDNHADSYVKPTISLTVLLSATDHQRPGTVLFSVIGYFVADLFSLYKIAWQVNQPVFFSTSM